MKFKPFYRHRFFQGVIVIYKISVHSQEYVKIVHAEIAFDKGELTDKVKKLFTKYDLDPIKIDTSDTYEDFICRLYLENQRAEKKFLHPTIQEFFEPIALKEMEKFIKLQ